MIDRTQWIAATVGAVALHGAVLYGANGAGNASLPRARAGEPIQARVIFVQRDVVTTSTPVTTAKPPVAEAAMPLEAVPVAAQPPLATAAISASRSARATQLSSLAAAPESVLTLPPTETPMLRHDAVVSASGATAAPAYRTGAELDPPPQPLGDIDPEYPAAAGLQQGTVVLRLLIGRTGSVDDIQVVRATPPGVFDASAIAAFGAAKFSPGRYLGSPVPSQITIAVDYTPTNRGNAVAGQGGLVINR